MWIVDCDYEGCKVLSLKNLIFVIKFILNIDKNII